MGGNVLSFLLKLWSDMWMVMFVTGAVLPVIGPGNFFTRGYCIIFIFFFQYSGCSPGPVLFVPENAVRINGGFLP